MMLISQSLKFGDTCPSENPTFRWAFRAQRDGGMILAGDRGNPTLELGIASCWHDLLCIEYKDVQGNTRLYVYINIKGLWKIAFKTLTHHIILYWPPGLSKGCLVHSLTWIEQAVTSNVWTLIHCCSRSAAFKIQLLSRCLTLPETKAESVDSFYVNTLPSAVAIHTEFPD